MNDKTRVATTPNGTPERTRRPQNTELQLLARIDRILAEVDKDLAKRAIAWFAAREFGGNWTLTSPEAKP